MLSESESQIARNIAQWECKKAFMMVWRGWNSAHFSWFSPRKTTSCQKTLIFHAFEHELEANSSYEGVRLIWRPTTNLEYFRRIASLLRLFPMPYPHFCGPFLHPPLSIFWHHHLGQVWQDTQDRQRSSGQCHQRILQPSEGRWIYYWRLLWFLSAFNDFTWTGKKRDKVESLKMQWHIIAYKEVRHHLFKAFLR